MDEWVVRAANSTTYTPFGSFYEGQCIETLANPWKFTGQWYDEEIGQYYLRARQYDPAMMRFTSRDPARGSRQEPLTLHKYLYTGNGPVNRTDLTGKAALNIAKTVISGYEAHALAIGIAAYAVTTNSDVLFDIAITIDSNLIKVMALSALGFSTNTAVVAVTMPDFWDLTKSPGDGWVWRGKGEVGSPDGAWYNPDIDESLHPDLDHPGPVGPHWDHVDKDGKKWRIKPDGTAEPK